MLRRRIAYVIEHLSTVRSDRAGRIGEATVIRHLTSYVMLVGL